MAWGSRGREPDRSASLKPALPREPRQYEPAMSPLHGRMACVRKQAQYQGDVLEHGLGALLYLIGRQFFLVGRKKPDVSERVFQCAGSVAVQLVLHRFDDRCARANSPIKDGVHIFDVQCRPTGEPSDVCGLRNGLSPPQSSAIMMRESPIWISACPTLPPGASSLNDSVAPKARR